MKTEKTCLEKGKNPPKIEHPAIQQNSLPRKQNTPPLCGGQILL
jgi:hypothetical protein